MVLFFVFITGITFGKPKLSYEFLSDSSFSFIYTEQGQSFSHKKVSQIIEKISQQPLTSDGIFSVKVESDSQCFEILAGAERVTRVCPKISENTYGFKFQVPEVKAIYGGGEFFRNFASTEGDWLGKKIESVSTAGNTMRSWAGGAVGETQFPVTYYLTSTNIQTSILLDTFGRTVWDFQSQVFTVESRGKSARAIINFSDSLMKLRRAHMDLTGHAPVPPKKIFGLWLSEYGYRNWGEVDAKLASMRRDGFPIDGFFLDLQWFGGVTEHSEFSRMGSLSFDTNNFPNPTEKMRQYRTEDEIALIPIEESYVSRSLSEHKNLESRGFMAHHCGEPTHASFLTGDVHGNDSEWWGRGGMIDWSTGGLYWHKTKRKPLILAGIYGHWLDLGEPEMFDSSACYGVLGGEKKHADFHNEFNFAWAKSVFEGYLSDPETKGKRPFMMMRSGTMGIQRFGGGMWSGDIGGNLESLATHHNAGMHLSFAGVDYLSSDVGGFHRNRADGNKLSFDELQESFTQWFAMSSWFDIPFRTHTLNLNKEQETAPNKIGDVKSNYANLKRRYELVPYYYSWAHHIAKSGEPFFAPLVLKHQADETVYNLGHQKYVGPSILVALTAKLGEMSRDVYLPAGVWYEFETLRKVTSAGQWVRNIPVLRADGLFKPIAFAKAGAIIPYQKVDRKTLGSKPTHSEIHIKIFPGVEKSSFDLYEDDGETNDYKSGSVARTHIEQQLDNDGRLFVNVFPTVGTFPGQKTERKVVFDIVSATDKRNIHSSEVFTFAHSQGRRFQF